MSYQVLARKWQPQTFADVVGQEHVLTALANGLSLGAFITLIFFRHSRGREDLHRPSAGERVKL